MSPRSALWWVAVLAGALAACDRGGASGEDHTSHLPNDAPELFEQTRFADAGIGRKAQPIPGLFEK